MTGLNKNNLDTLTLPGPRLPELERWLRNDVWTSERFVNCASSPSQYLQSGEKIINQKENLLAASAQSLFDELTANSLHVNTVSSFFSEHPDGSAVVFDGCSLRELPRLLSLAESSKRPVLSVCCGRSAFPSTTEYFISDRLGFNLPVLSPSELITRHELKEQNVSFYYFGTPNAAQTLSEKEGAMIIWSRFPDLRFMDSSACGAEMYDGIWDSFELAWRNTVQAIPPEKTILVTSDHGYVFLGAGLSDQNLEGKSRPLNGKRYKVFKEDEELPGKYPHIWLDNQRRIGAIMGRCHNRPQAPSASHSLYRHGGISLMEVLTPQLILGPMEGYKQ